ncbi:MAG TPA: hypothetical protein OQH54_01195 [Nitrosopumilus sp.]|nr:hypothetical protein [Thermoproteota archaeon]HJJ22321.1 hypothetical protein [Nitrosopumilus sp.]
MSIIETITDVDNTFLSRRELTCNFAGLGGKLKKMEAVDMVTKEFKLDGKIVIPMGLKTHVGKPMITGTFYVYDDEGLAKKQVNPTIFARLEKMKTKLVEAEAAKEAPAEDVVKEAPAEDVVKEAPAEDVVKEAEVKADESTEEPKEEEKSE